MPSFDISAPKAPSLIINVLDGPLSTTTLMAGKPPGVIELDARYLPYRSTLSFSGNQRVKTKFYPGNTEGTQQLMGDVLEPSSMNGMWKDKFIGDGNAMAMCLLFERVRRLGSRLGVSWSEVARIGVLKTFKFTPENPQDIAWEATFEWASMGESVAPLITSSAAHNPREALQAVFDATTASVAETQSFVDSTIARLVGFADSVISNMDAAVNRLTDYTIQIRYAVEVLTMVAELPREAVERAITVSRAIAASLREVEEGILDPLLELRDPGDAGIWLGLKDLAFSVKDDALGLLVYLDQKHSVLASCQRGRETCINTADQLETLLFPEVIAEERPPMGTDLRDLARKHYGDPDLWFLIAQFNGLSSSVVPALPTGPSDNPARPIRVPRRQTGELGNLRRAC